MFVSVVSFFLVVSMMLEFFSVIFNVFMCDGFVLLINVNARGFGLKNIFASFFLVNLSVCVIV